MYQKQVDEDAAAAEHAAELDVAKAKAASDEAKRMAALDTIETGFSKRTRDLPASEHAKVLKKTFDLIINDGRARVEVSSARVFHILSAILLLFVFGNIFHFPKLIYL